MGCAISDSALVDAAVLSDRYIADRFLPDKAIDLVSAEAARSSPTCASSQPCFSYTAEMTLLKNRATSGCGC